MQYLCCRVVAGTYADPRIAKLSSECPTSRPPKASQRQDVLQNSLENFAVPTASAMRLGLQQLIFWPTLKCSAKNAVSAGIINSVRRLCTALLNTVGSVKVMLGLHAFKLTHLYDLHSHCESYAYICLLDYTHVYALSFSLYSQ